MERVDSTAHRTHTCTQLSHLLLSLEVVEENRALLRLLTPVLDDNARAVDDLTGVTLTVKLACLLLANAIYHNPGTQNKGKDRDNIQRPTHSPSIFPSGTLIKGILCSEQSATTNFLYASSSQPSFRTHMCAWRRSRVFAASRRPRARPSWISEIRSTPFRASRTLIWPDALPESADTSTSSAATGGLDWVSSPSDCFQFVSFRWSRLRSSCNNSFLSIPLCMFVRLVYSQMSDYPQRVVEGEFLIRLLGGLELR